MNTTEELRCELDHTDRRTLALIESLTDAQLDVPYHRGINPPIWELGHSAFFYEYFLLRKLGHAEPRMPGYDEIWDSFEIQHRNRWQDDVIPSKESTFDYYHRVLDETRKRLQVEELDPQEHYLCQYCIVHQNMHIESLIWARQTLGYPAPPSMISGAQHHAGPDPGGDAQVPGGTYAIGMPANSPEFATRMFSFDNERPGFETEVEPFAISKALVSNRAFLAFVKDGGYQSPEVWSYGGRWWLQEEGPAHPLYWREKKKDTWELRRFDQWIALPLDAPVLHVSYWEAEAFCNWADRRLPTEYEWEAAARGTKGTLFPWGDEMDPTRADLDVEEMGSANVDAFPASATPSGCLQMIGTAWEWTSNQYLPYPGFEVDIYPYMSTLQFGDHKTTKGGSCATSSCLIRSSYRQAYSPGRRDVFTGIRTCAK
jgi:iron(II)-dependent oxidoreductase